MCTSVVLIIGTWISSALIIRGSSVHPRRTASTPYSRMYFSMMSISFFFSSGMIMDEPVKEIHRLR